MRSFKALCLSSLLIIATLPSVPAMGAPAVGAPKIASISIENGTPLVTAEIRKILPLHEGEYFDPAKVEQAISYLRKWGRFQRVDYRKTESSAGVHLHFGLKEGSLVSGIDIYGGYPYLSARLRRMITVHSGDLYDPEEAKAQEEKLASFYERKGFHGTRVNLTPRRNEKKGTVDLVYRIEKGNRYRLGKITVIGNRVFPYRYFVSQLNPLLAYEPARLRKGLERIQQDYRDKGYLQARVRLKDLRKDQRKVNPLLEISEGKQVTVVFEGNKRVSRRTFKKVLPMFTEGGYGDYEIQSSIRAMLDYYRHLGFQEATVTTEEKKPGEERLLIRFLIEEGPQTRVKKIRIVGSEETSDRGLKKELATREESIFQDGIYQPRMVDQDLTNLPRILQNRGALGGEVLGETTTLNRFHDKAEVTFSIREGEITRIRVIRFNGNEHLSSGRLHKHLKLREGDPFSPERVEREREAIAMAYANAGFPYAKVTHDLTGEGPRALLTYQIQEGEKAVIGEILVVGNERTAAKAVERAILLRKGQPFSYKKVLESESSLRRSGSFRSVRIETIGLAEKEPVVHLLVKLEEYRRILVDAGVTYDTDNQFTGNLTLSYLNLFRAAKNGFLKLTGGRDIQKGELIVKDHHFLGYNFEMVFNTLLERQRRPGFETREGGGSLSFLREFTPRTAFLGRYEIIRTFFTDVADPTGAAEEDHTTSKFVFSFSYDKRDSFAHPRSGFVGFAGVDLSNRLIASTSNFLQPKGYFADYRKLGVRMTLLNFVRLEGIKVFGADTLARDQKLFLGGDYSVRGFDEDAVGPIGTDGRPAGGQLLLAYTTELQTRLFKDIELALFLDHGSLTNDFSDLGLGSLRHSAGLGFRYLTPVGPLRLDYGIKLDKAAGEAVGRLHFAFGYAF